MRGMMLNIILAFNMAVGLVFTANVSNQEISQTEASTELGVQTVEEGSTESLADGENHITEEKEDTSTSTVTADKTGITEIETETVGNTMAETELTSETEVPGESEIETEPITENETKDETEPVTESETTMETETMDETEVEMETRTVTEIEKIAEEKLVTDSVVYSVALPAIDEFRFILDPFGLRGLSEGKSASLEELKPYAGKIYCNKKMMITNKSSVPVRVKVSIQLTGDIHAAESVEDMESDAENNVILYIIPSENDLEGSLDNYQKTNIGIVVKKDEPTVLEFVLPESKYLYKESAEGESMVYEIADGEKGHSAAFEIAGLVNTKANWKKFNEDGKKVGLEVNYSYEDASNQPAEYSWSRGAFALLPYDGATVDVAEME